MSETKHSPEPWFGYDGSHFASTCGSKSVWVGKASLNADARRIVAAVNAVAGIPTEALESGALGAALVHAGDLLAHVDKECEESDCETRLGLIAALRSLGRLP